MACGPRLAGAGLRLLAGPLASHVPPGPCDAVDLKACGGGVGGARGSKLLSTHVQAQKRGAVVQPRLPHELGERAAANLHHAVADVPLPLRVDEVSHGGI